LILADDRDGETFRRRRQDHAHSDARGHGARVFPSRRALETSLPGVFAAGDVRHRSPRGVTAAVADGAIAIRSVREYLGGE